MKKIIARILVILFILLFLILIFYQIYTKLYLPFGGISLLYLICFFKLLVKLLAWVLDNL